MTAQPPSLTDGAEHLLAETAWLRGLIAHLVRDPHEREDIAQEVGALALRQTPEQLRSVRGWLAAVVRSVAGRRRQRAALGRLGELHAARPEAEPSAHDVVARVESHRRVVETVLALEEPYRSVVLLRFFEGRKPAAIAVALGCPVATVNTRLSRGLQMLRARLQRAFGGRHDWALICGVPGLWREALAAKAATDGVIAMAMHKKILALVGVVLAIGAGVLLSQGSGDEPMAGVGEAAALASPPPAAQIDAVATSPGVAGAARTEIDEPTVEVVPEPAQPVRASAGEVVAIVVDAQGRLLAGAQVWRAVVRADDDEPMPEQLLDTQVSEAPSADLRHALNLFAANVASRGAVELSFTIAPAAEAKPAEAGKSPPSRVERQPLQLLLSGADGKGFTVSGLPLTHFTFARGATDHDRSLLYDLQPIGRTGRDGRCRFHAEGAVKLVATTPGTSSGIVAFELPAQGAEVVLPVVPTCNVHGVVVDAVGKPLEGATVSAAPEGETFPHARRMTTTTDRDGRFSLSLDALGDFVLTATADKSESEQLYLQATPGAGLELRVRMLGAVVVEGSLLGSTGGPIADGRVRVARLDRDPQADPRVRPFEANASSDAQGNFRVLLPSAGEYLFAANPEGHAPLEATNLTVQVGVTPPRLRLQCRNAAAMHGHVRWSGGQAIVGAQVVATPTHAPASRTLSPEMVNAVRGEVRSAEVQADGSYRIDGLAEHLRYRLACRPQARGAVREEREQLAPSLQDFTFDQAQVRGATVRVLVQPSSGATVGDAMVIVAHRDAQGVWRKQEGRGVSFDAQGQANIDGLIPGATAAIEVRCDGLGRCRSEPFVAGGVADVTLRPQPAGRLEVVVLDPAGRPCLGAKIVLREQAADGLRREDSVRTADVLGQAIWESVSVLPWTVSAERGGLRAAAQPVVIESGGTVRVELKLAR